MVFETQWKLEVLRVFMTSKLYLLSKKVRNVMRNCCDSKYIFFNQKYEIYFWRRIYIDDFWCIKYEYQRSSLWFQKQSMFTSWIFPMIALQKHVSLKSYNTFSVDVQADFFVDIQNEQEIFDLISMDVFASQPRLILGGWANILFTKDYHGLVVKISLMGKTVVKEENNLVYIKAGAGENRHEVMMRSLQQWYVWGENLVLIPGQVWSAPVGNIGAYGKEAKDIIHEVEWIDLMTKEKKTRNASACKFGYRDSIFKQELKNKVIITAVTFVFNKQSSDYIPNIEYADIQQSILAAGKNPATISAQDIADIIIAIREKKLPDRTKIGTAGSFFKNPIVEKNQFEWLVLKYPQLKWNEIHISELWILHSAFKLSAGQLIELAGFKGKSEWQVGTYNNHALIIVNNGGASGSEIRAFAQSIQKKVLELFWVILEPEVIIL